MLPILMGIFGFLSLVFSLWFVSRNQYKPQRPVYEGQYKQKLQEQLVSWEYGLTGKPDYIVDHQGFPVPVLVKKGVAPTAEPHDSHIAQVIVYCLLVHETTTVAPPYGIVRYDDRVFEIDYNEPAINALFQVLDDIRATRRDIEIPYRSHDSERQCVGCRHHRICEESLF